MGIELAAGLRRVLGKLLRQEVPRTPAVRWCSEEQLHITLKFLGQVAEARMVQVCEVVSAASARLARFPVRSGGLGCFPAPGRARVLWCGIEDRSAGCARWLAAAEPGLAKLGFEREGRAYHPHITLGRSRSPAGAGVIRGVLERVRPPEAVEMVVEEVVVFESRLGPGGARYVPLARARLRGEGLDSGAGAG